MTEHCENCQFFSEEQHRMNRQQYPSGGIAISHYSYNECRRKSPPFPMVTAEDWCGEWMGKPNA
jgi:hypothetical protein